MSIAPHPDLELITAPPRIAPGAVIVSTTLRNEALRLPYYLAYYRRLGVSNFLIIDNGSTDGTLDILSAARDVTVYRTAASFARARSGTTWVTALLHAYGLGHWCFLADPDEIFIYPGLETMPLGTFLGFLDSHGFDAVTSSVLDMYAPGRLLDVHYAPPAPFHETCPCHDTHYFKLPRHPLAHLSAYTPDDQIIGGPRTRLMYPSQMTPHPLPHLIRRGVSYLYRRSIQRLTGRPLVASAPAPFNFKMSLVRWGSQSRFHGPHYVPRCHPAPFYAAILHFKFFQDFTDRVRVALAENQHANGASEYRRYAQFLGQNPNFTLVNGQTARFTTTLELSRTCPIFEDHLLWRGYRCKYRQTGTREAVNPLVP